MPLTRYMIKHVHWPLMEKWKGNRIRAYLHELEQAQSLPFEQLQARQESKLQKLLHHAVERVPAYQAYREELAREDEPASTLLTRIPSLNKLQFRANHDAYLTIDANPASLIANRTGGSTGEPTRFYMDRPTVERYEAARWLGLSWYGIGIGDPCVMIWGSPLELSQGKSVAYRLKERYLKNRLLISAYEIREAKLPAYIKLIRSFKPHYLYGYASALHLFADMMLRRELSLDIPLKAVVSTAESLHPDQRETIARAFGAPVVNEYGARDGGIIAYECPKGRMHIFSENCYLEVVDPVTRQPVPPGKSGLVLVTDLHNFAMPRLRYELGDVIKLSGEPCSCGIRYPVLDSIDGREDDIFLSLRGHYIHGHYFNHIARNMESFQTFQIIQHEPDRVSLKLVKHPDHYSLEEEEAFLAAIRRALGDEIILDVKHVDEIPPSASGKYRYAIREFPLLSPET
jgi:phenylacetate-CoA ligase